MMIFEKREGYNLDNFVNFLNAKILPFANKMGTQRHMTAIRKGIISTLPLTIVGSFFTIINNIPIEAVANMLAPYKEILDIPIRLLMKFLRFSQLKMDCIHRILLMLMKK